MNEIYTITPDSLIDWYWEHGIKRSAPYQLSIAWLADTVACVQEASAIHKAETKYQKAAMALWGPSQSGKSTMLARFIDGDPGNETEQTLGNALSWNGDPVRFSGNTDKDGNTVILNPYNQGADASGCVTRFCMVDAVDYPDYPVEIEFADNTEILLSMAVGYVNETCALNDEECVTYWQKDSLMKMARNSCFNVVKGHSARNKEAFKLLLDAFNVVDILLEMGVPRYDNLRPTWSECRLALLKMEELYDSEEQVRQFIGYLFWDNWSTMNSLFKNLSEKSRELRGARYFASHRLANVLLDISAPAHYVDPAYQITISRVDTCRKKKLEDGVYALDCAKVVGGTAPEGDKFFKDASEFAHIQGLVSQIIVPLRSEVIKCHNATVHELLLNADLVDFPGVANEHRGAKLLTNEQLNLDYYDPERNTRPLSIFSQVLKRGKTASIVVSSSRNLNIDVFSLLTRMPAGADYPPHPQQLTQGISCWCHYMGKDVSDSLPKDKELSINLVLTKTVELVRMVKPLNMAEGGLSLTFGKLNSMGDLSNPSVVHAFCVNYDEVPNMEIDSVTATYEERHEVWGKIRNDSSFNKLLEEHACCLDHVLRVDPQGNDISDETYGARIYFFEQAIAQLRSTPRSSLLQKKKAVITEKWIAALKKALPVETPESIRDTDINKVIAALQAPTSDKAAEDFKNRASAILGFMNIDPNTLDELPDAPEQGQDYINSEINKWYELGNTLELQRIMGFDDMDHRNRIMNYFSQSAREGITEFVGWLGALINQDAVISVAQQNAAKRLIATMIVNLIFRMHESVPHRDMASSAQVMRNMCTGKIDSAHLQNSAHYTAVIAPFIRRLEIVRDTGKEEMRGQQAGDAEISALVGQLPEAPQEETPAV